MKWEEKEISEVCTSIIDCVNRTAPKVDYPTPYKMIRTSNVKDGRINTDDVFYVSEEIFKQWSRRGKPQIGDVILTREAPVGEVGIVRTDEQIFLGQRIMQYRANPAQINPQFLYYHFRTAFIQAQINSFASGSTVAHVRVPDSKKIRVLVPPLPTQQKIASILSAYDDLIENNLKRIRLLEEAAQHLYREWFVRFRFPGWETVRVVDGLPEGWERKVIGEVIEYHIGGGWGQDEFQGDFMLPAFVIRGTDIPKLQRGNSLEVPFRFHTKSNLASRKLHNGDLVFEVSGGSKGQPIGRSLLITTKILDFFGENDVICASFCKLIRVNQNIFSPYYFGAFIKESYLNGTLARFENQSASNIINFRFNDFLNREEIIVPSKNILEVFENVLASINNQIAVLGLQNQKLKQARDLLLPRLMNQTIEV